MVISASVFGQDNKSNEPAPMSGEFLEARYWTSLGKPTEGTRGYSLLTRNMQPKTDANCEFWVKIVPVNASSFNRRYSLPRESAYVIQRATVDCSKRTVFLDRTAAFDVSNNSLDPKGSDLIKGDARSRVKAGSVSETLFDFICLKLQ